MEPGWLTTLRAQTENRSDPWVLLEGQASVEAALAGWWEIPGVLVSEDHPWEAPMWAGLELLRTAREEVEALADPESHQGILGLAKLPRETGDIAPFLKGLEAEALIVVCTRLSDPDVVGSIVRSAEAFDAAGLLFGSEGISPFEPSAVRASESAVFRLPVRIGDGGLILRCLLAAGFQLIGLDEDEGAIAASDLPPLAPRRALVLGAEDEGLGNFWKRACNLRVNGQPDVVLSAMAM